MKSLISFLGVIANNQARLIANERNQVDRG